MAFAYITDATNDEIDKTSDDNTEETDMDTQSIKGAGFTTAAALMNKKEIEDEEARLKYVAERKRLKAERKKERRKQKKQALANGLPMDSSMLDSSMLDSSVLNGSARGRSEDADGRDDEEAALQLRSSPPVNMTMNGWTKHAEPAAEHDSPANEVYEQESQDMIALVRKEELAKSKEAKTQSAQDKDAKKGKKTKKAKKADTTEEESAPVVEDRTIPEQDPSLADLPGKLKKAKQKLRKSQKNASPAQEDVNSAAPAHNTRSRSQSLAPEDVAATTAQAGNKAGPAKRPVTIMEEEEPERPAKKVSEKRKASNVEKEPPSKRRKAKGKAAAITELLEPEISVPGDVSGDSISGSRPGSAQIRQLAELANLAEGLAEKSFASEMAQELERSQSEAFQQSHNAITSREQRRATPAFTPINRRKPTAATVDPTEPDPFVLPPSSQPQPEPSQAEPSQEVPKIITPEDEAPEASIPQDPPAESGSQELPSTLR